jgi:hypothetical protein
MRDQWFGARGWLGLAEVVLVQALPLPALLIGARARAGDRRSSCWKGTASRSGSACSPGIARAYDRSAVDYVLSPLADAALAARSSRARSAAPHRWRGLVYRRDGARTLHAS